MQICGKSVNKEALIFEQMGEGGDVLGDILDQSISQLRK